MGISRKRKRELRKLKGKAEQLWHEQQEVLDRAGSVAREASRQAGLYTREQVGPKVAATYDERLRPGVDQSVKVTKAVASTARDKVVDDIFPALAGVGASAVSVLDMANDVRHKLGKDAGKKIDKAGKKINKATKNFGHKKSGPGAGTYVLIAVGIVALAGVAYAAWQTFRADDDLWIADDEPEAAPGDVEPKA
ncbi:MAG: hypothetical protein ABWZ77_02055 [Naasia sp.]